MAPAAEMDKMMKNSTPKDMKEGMEKWTTWIKAHKADFVDEGAALGKNKRVMRQGVSQTRNEVTGYGIVKAESHDAAAELFTDSPHFEIPGAYIDVLEWVDMPSET